MMKVLRTLAVAAGVTLVAAGPKQAKAEDAPVHHLDFDRIDKKYLCIGSPVDCDFGETSPEGAE